MRARPEPVSRLARWAHRLAVFALAVALAGVGLARAGAASPPEALAVLAAALGLAGFGALLAVAGLVAVWREGLRGAGRALRALLIALGLLGPPAYLAGRAAGLPVLNDVTTDPADPPALPPREGRPSPSPSPADREAARAAYPDLRPIALDLAPEEAFALARRAALALGWELREEAPPVVASPATPPAGAPPPAPRPRAGARGARPAAAPAVAPAPPAPRDGRLAGVARTPLLRFEDDVVVRVRAAGDGARVDARSASRVGRGDLGANAARLRRFAEEVARLARE